MYKRITLIIVMIMFLLSLYGCSIDPLSNNVSIENHNEDIIVENEYNSWIVNSESEYIIIENTLYGRGKNSLGLFGNDINYFSETWNKIANNVKHIEGNDDVLLYLTFDGDLYGLGNQNNKIFIKETKNNIADSKITKPILLESDCKYVSFSNEFIAIIKNDNTLWCWGESENGQGTIVTDVISKPLQIASNIQFVKTFGFSVAWIDTNGNLYLCGDNSFNQIGNETTGAGSSEKRDDIVTTPFCALKKCNNFSVTDNMIIKANTIDGKEYMWGNYHNSTPTERSKELPLKTEPTDFSKGITIEDNNVLRKKDYPIVFYKEKDKKGNLSIISKSSDLDSDKSIVKTELAPPFTMSLVGNSLIISSKNDNFTYLLTYNEISSAQINDIKLSLLYENYAIPVYVKYSNHLVLALPESYKELILNTHSGEINEGEFWDYSKFDNKPSIKPSEAKTIALKELKKTKYITSTKKECDYSKIESISLVLEPCFQNLWLTSWTTQEFFKNKDSINWCYHITVSNTQTKNDVMDVLIDSNSGDIYSITNVSD